MWSTTSGAHLANASAKHKQGKNLEQSVAPKQEQKQQEPQSLPARTISTRTISHARSAPIAIPKAIERPVADLKKKQTRLDEALARFAATIDKKPDHFSNALLKKRAKQLAYEKGHLEQDEKADPNFWESFSFLLAKGLGDLGARRMEIEAKYVEEQDKIQKIKRLKSDIFQAIFNAAETYVLLLNNTKQQTMSAVGNDAKTVNSILAGIFQDNAWQTIGNSFKPFVEIAYDNVNHEFKLSSGSLKNPNLDELLNALNKVYIAVKDNKVVSNPFYKPKAKKIENLLMHVPGLVLNPTFTHFKLDSDMVKLAAEVAALPEPQESPKQKTKTLSKSPEEQEEDLSCDVLDERAKEFEQIFQDAEELLEKEYKAALKNVEDFIQKTKDRAELLDAKIQEEKQKDEEATKAQQKKPLLLVEKRDELQARYDALTSWENIADHRAPTNNAQYDPMPDKFNAIKEQFEKELESTQKEQFQDAYREADKVHQPAVQRYESYKRDLKQKLESAKQDVKDLEERTKLALKVFKELVSEENLKNFWRSETITGWFFGTRGGEPIEIGKKPKTETIRVQKGMSWLYNEVKDVKVDELELQIAQQLFDKIVTHLYAHSLTKNDRRQESAKTVYGACGPLVGDDLTDEALETFQGKVRSLSGRDGKPFQLLKDEQNPTQAPMAP